MIVLELIGGQLVLNDVQTFGVAAMRGSIEGVKKSADILAQDIRGHTPRKTGKAQESVIVRPSQGGKVQTVRFDYRKSRAFYMRFVILGAQPHDIRPKKRTDRGRRSAQKKRLTKLQKAGMTFGQAYTEAALYAAGLTRKSAMYFQADGQGVFTRMVRHPGVRPMKIISERMRASQGEIVTALQQGIRDGIEKAYRTRIPFGSAQWTGSGWSHEK